MKTAKIEYTILSDNYLEKKCTSTLLSINVIMKITRLIRISA